MSDILFNELAGSDGAIGEITLNRPTVLNALTHEMFIQLDQQLIRWAEQKNIKAVLIRAVPGRAFCAGGDLRLLFEAKKSNTVSSEAGANFFLDEYRTNRRVFHFPKPYISFLDGITMGGGAGISVHGSHRIATERLLFAMPETGIGLFPDVGGSHFLSRCPGKVGTYLGLTGARLAASDALYAGLVDVYIPSNALDEVAAALLMTEYGRDPFESVDHILQRFAKTLEPAPLSSHRASIDRCFDNSHVEAIFKALERENTEWSQATLTTLKSKSPTSLKVTLQEIRTATNLEFDECMHMEYRLVNRFLDNHDLYEGIRAVLIEKTQQPHWSPNRVEDVTEEAVAAYFAPLGKGKEFS